MIFVFWANINKPSLTFLGLGAQLIGSNIKLKEQQKYGPSWLNSDEARFTIIEEALDGRIRTQVADAHHCQQRSNLITSLHLIAFSYVFRFFRIKPNYIFQPNYSSFLFFLFIFIIFLRSLVFNANFIKF
jgi:hypothetical protein